MRDLHLSLDQDEHGVLLITLGDDALTGVEGSQLYLLNK